MRAPILPLLPLLGASPLLWLRGDDFGYTHASNVAMDEAFNSGLMTSGSLLVPGPWLAETASWARTTFSTASRGDWSPERG